MAGIDKLYLTNYKNVIEFYEWAEMYDEQAKKETQQSLLECFYYKHFQIEPNKPYYIVMYLPNSIYKWLLYHCPFNYVRSYLYYLSKPSFRDKKRLFFYINKDFNRDEFRLNRTIYEIREKLNRLENYNYITKADLITITKLKTVLININNGDSQYKFINYLGQDSYLIN